jgi:hypothetical protein
LVHEFYRLLISGSRRPAFRNQKLQQQPRA